MGSDQDKGTEAERSAQARREAIWTAYARGWAVAATGGVVDPAKVGTSWDMFHEVAGFVVGIQDGRQKFPLRPVAAVAAEVEALIGAPG